MAVVDKETKPSISLRYEGKFLAYGILTGCLLFMLWSYLFFPIVNNYIERKKLENFASIAEIQLLEYINGKWTSSIGDVIVVVDVDKNRDFIILSILNNEEEEIKYKIKRIAKVNGLMGIVKLDICKENSSCDDKFIIPIQFNKMFGLDRTIAITYDSRLTYCIESDDKCTRAFKRIE